MAKTQLRFRVAKTQGGCVVQRDLRSLGKKANRNLMKCNEEQCKILHFVRTPSTIKS